MAHATLGQENLIDLTYYPVILTRGSWESSLPLANLKDPLLVKAAQSTDAALASTQFEIDYSVSREIKVSFVPIPHNLREGARYRKRYTDTPSFADGLTVNGGHAVGATSISLSGTGIPITVHADDYLTFGSDVTPYKATGTVTVPSGGTASTSIAPALASGLSHGMVVTCRTGDYSSPLRDTGWLDVWGEVYPWGTLLYGHPSFYTGTFTSEEFARKKMPVIDVVPDTTFARYELIEIDDTGNDDGCVRLPRFYASSGWQPTINIAYGLKKGRISHTQKENAAFTWYGFLRTPANISSNYGLFGTDANTSANVGIHCLMRSGDLTLQVAAVSGAALNVSTGGGFISAATNYLIAISYNEATGAGLFYRKGAAGKATAAISGSHSLPSGSAATYAMQIGAGGNNANPLGNGSRLWRTGMFNRALGAAQLDVLFERYKPKLGL